MAKVRVKLVKSVIGSSESQRACVKTLGLGKLNSTVEHDATPQIRGIIRKVQHLLKVEEVE